MNEISKPMWCPFVNRTCVNEMCHGWIQGERLGEPIAGCFVSFGFGVLVDAARAITTIAQILQMKNPPSKLYPL